MRIPATLLVALVAARAAAQPAPGTPPVVVEAYVDRTALWPGDHVRYVLEITCAPGVDVLADDLAGEKLALTGLELVGSSKERHAEPGSPTRYRVEHRLTAYTFGTPLAIAPQTLRYPARRAEAAEAEGAPAGEVLVPGRSLALRSTLPDALSEVQLRDDAPPMPLPRAVAWLRPAGVALLLVSALPVAMGLALLGRRAATALRGRKPRKGASDLRRDVESLHSADTRSEAARREAYDRLDALLRQRLTELAGVDARALTAAEIARVLQARAVRAPEALPVILDECERARYGRADILPPPERFSAGVATAAELVKAR